MAVQLPKFRKQYLGQIVEKQTSKPNWTSRIDRLVQYLKWPSALAAALVTPLLAWSLILLLVRILGNPFGLVPYAAGALLFVLAWRRWMADKRLGRFIITLEHEATHALFALLTLHKVVGFRATMGEGGEVRYKGNGNWLITVAPYFFPTAALLLFFVAYLAPFPGLPWQSFLLGVALGYHIVSTIRETHRDQTDIHELGWTFCWLFLPAANLAVVGLLTSFAYDGSEGMTQWISSLTEPLQYIFPATEVPPE